MGKQVMYLDKQAVYNQVRDHLLAQNKRSEQFSPQNNETMCAYRGQDGLKCAVGVLIKDEYFRPTINSLNLESPQVLIALEDSLGLPGISNDEIYFLNGLQTIHDLDCPTAWKTKLTEFALSHSLTP